MDDIVMDAPYQSSVVEECLNNAEVWFA